jgi:hypothetical protein
MADRLIGTVDGVAAGELNGWLANLDDPSVCETIIVRGAGGTQRDFKTFQLREDVCAALSLPGTFGFSIPLRALADLGACVSVHDRNGQPLTNGLDLTITRQIVPGVDDVAPRCARLFLHIPKTAGTSLRADIAGQLRYSETLLVYPGSGVGLSLEQLAAMPDHQKRQFSLVFGHFFVGLHRLIPQPSHYVTFVREARSRLRSNVMHHATLGTTFAYEGIACPPSLAINEGLDEQFDNLMTRIIAGVTIEEVPRGSVGSRELDMAIDNIRRHFAFVGQYECLQHSLDQLCRLLGVAGVPVSEANRTADRPIVYHEDEMQKINWPSLFARNRIDILLYSYLHREKLLARALSPHP